MVKTLNRKKIHGISFRSPTRQKVATKENIVFFENLDLQELHYKVRTQSPKNLNNFEIRFLLQDFSRNKIHSHISECVDQIAFWRKIVRLIDKHLNYHRSLTTSDDFLYEKNDDVPFSVTEKNCEIFIAVRKTYLSWKHRLKILEMICQAQYNLLKIEKR